MNNRRKLLLAFLLLFPALASAQNFPAKPIKLIVPFPAGGPNDIIARVIGQRMSELSGQPVLIDNRGGQGGVLGTDAVAKAAPTATPSRSPAPARSRSARAWRGSPTTPLKRPHAGDAGRDRAGNAGGRHQRAREGHRRADRARQGAARKAQFRLSGPGSLPHLAGELFKLTAKIDIVHVPYRGAAPAVNDLLGQQVQMTFLDLPVLLPQVKAGALQPIAVGSAERAPTAPDVPTTAEAGLPIFASRTGTAWWRRRARRQEIVTALHGSRPRPWRIPP